jgi:hypothetical protein
MGPTFIQSREVTMSQQASTPGQIHVEGLTPDVLDDLLREYPAIRPFSTPSPSNTSVAEQPEKALLDLAIVLAPPTIRFGERRVDQPRLGGHADLCYRCGK